MPELGLGSNDNVNILSFIWRFCRHTEWTEPISYRLLCSALGVSLYFCTPRQSHPLPTHTFEITPFGETGGGPMTMSMTMSYVRHILMLWYSGADPEGGFGGFEPPPWSSKSFTSTVKLPSPNVSHSGGALWGALWEDPEPPPSRNPGSAPDTTE